MLRAIVRPRNDNYDDDITGCDRICAGSSEGDQRDQGSAAGSTRKLDHFPNLDCLSRTGNMGDGRSGRNGEGAEDDRYGNTHMQKGHAQGLPGGDGVQRQHPTGIHGRSNAGRKGEHIQSDQLAWVGAAGVGNRYDDRVPVFDRRDKDADRIMTCQRM